MDRGLPRDEDGLAPDRRLTIGCGLARSGAGFPARLSPADAELPRLIGGFLKARATDGTTKPAVRPAFKLPDAVHELPLTAHDGLPMLGVWEMVGIVVSLGFAVGGVDVGAWGFDRRDLRS